MEFAGKLNLRAIQARDIWLIWKWRNASDVRAQSLNESRISRDEHEKWFAQSLSDEDCAFFLAECEGAPVGQIRFDGVTGREAAVSIVVDAAHRGRGIGARLIRIGTRKVFAEHGVEVVTARIKSGNDPSRKAFLSAGYKLAGDAENGVLTAEARRD